jgi:hypothetical protein
MNYGKLLDYQVTGQKVMLRFADKEARIEVITPGIMLCSARGRMRTKVPGIRTLP